MTPSKIDPNTPFTQNLLRTLVATLPAQRDETEADYEERFATAAAYRPRDIVEQMLAAQIVAAHYSALDCLARAAEAGPPPATSGGHRGPVGDSAHPPVPPPPRRSECYARPHTT